MGRREESIKGWFKGREACRIEEDKECVSGRYHSRGGRNGGRGGSKTGRREEEEGKRMLEMESLIGR